MKPRLKLATARDVESNEWTAEDAAIAASEHLAARLGPDYRDTLLPAGFVVRAHFVGADTIRGTGRWVAHFLIAEDPEMGQFASLPIIRAWNPPVPGTRVARNHNLYRDYRAVTHLRALAVPKNHGPAAVLGSFLADVQIEGPTRVVARRMERETNSWQSTEAADHYSVLDRIASRTAGTPRVLQRRGARSKSPSESSSTSGR